MHGVKPEADAAALPRGDVFFTVTDFRGSVGYSDEAMARSLHEET